MLPKLQTLTFGCWETESRLPPSPSRVFYKRTRPDRSVPVWGRIGSDRISRRQDLAATAPAPLTLCAEPHIPRRCCFQGRIFQKKCTDKAHLIRFFMVKIALSSEVKVPTARNSNSIWICPIQFPLLDGYLDMAGRVQKQCEELAFSRNPGEVFAAFRGHPPCRFGSNDEPIAHHRDRRTHLHAIERPR